MIKDPSERDILKDLSEGRLSTMAARRTLGQITYGDLFAKMREAGLPMPQSSTQGREADIEKARRWMFPRHAT